MEITESAHSPCKSKGVDFRQKVHYVLAAKNYKIILLESDEPMTYGKALTSPNSANEIWIDSMYENQIWNLIELLRKARLVVKVYKQIHMMDCVETFSPVGILESILDPRKSSSL